METSILDTIKKMLGISESDSGFDQDIIVNINSAFMVMNQMGVGPATTFHVADNSVLWADFADEETYSAVKTYIYLKCRLTFDPPGTSFHLTAIENQIKELEFRLMAQVPITETPVEPEL